MPDHHVEDQVDGSNTETYKETGGHLVAEESLDCLCTSPTDENSVVHVSTREWRLCDILGIVHVA